LGALFAGTSRNANTRGAGVLDPGKRITYAPCEKVRKIRRFPIGSCPTTHKTYTATFNTQYFLAMTAGTGGTVAPASGWRNSGAAVSITGKPAPGYSFTNWTGTGPGSFSGTTNPASVTVGAPISAMATFTHN
jgi:hypothetical protein